MPNDETFGAFTDVAWMAYPFSKQLRVMIFTHGLYHKVTRTPGLAGIDFTVHEDDNGELHVDTHGVKWHLRRKLDRVIADVTKELNDILASKQEPEEDT